MENYYEMLNLDPASSVSDINRALSQLESTWKRREIYNPEKATAMLALIIEARKVFVTETSRRTYDRELENSKEKPSTPDPNTDRKLQFEKWRSDALSYFDSGQYDLAKTAIDRALSYYDTSTDDDQFFSLVADVYRMNHIYPTALDYINKAIVINPQNAMHYILKAVIFRDQASSVQKYSNYGEVQKVIQNARDSLNQAVSIARRNNDRTSESAAYGLLAFYHYYVPFPDRAKAEEYALKSVDMGDVWGSGSKVLDDIKQKRLQEAKEAEEEKRRQEQQAKEEQERKERYLAAERERNERSAAAVRERKRKESRKKTLYVLYCFCCLAFFGWFAFVFYSMIRLKDAYAFNVEVATAVFLIIIAVWNFLEKVSDAYSGAPKIIPFIFFGGYLFGAGTIKYTQWGYGAAQAERTWKFVGFSFLALFAVIVVFSLIGKAVRKGMD